MKAMNYALAVGVGLVCLMIPDLLQADATYTYTGNLYSSNFCNPLPCTPPSNLSGSFTVPNALAANLSSSFFTPSAFSFTDGLVPTLTKASALSVLTFQVWTDQNANIVNWGIKLATSSSVLSGCSVNGELIGSFSNPLPPNGDGASGDFSCFLVNQNTPSQAFGGGFNSGNPGTWTESTTNATPEPSSVLLLGSGLLGLVGLRRKQLA
jgi:PEP-CTERM motif-containing protein